MYPAPLARLIQELSKLPGIGEKSAARLAFHLLKGNKDDVFRLSDTIARLRQEMALCQRCFGFSEAKSPDDDRALCEICRKHDREQGRGNCMSHGSLHFHKVHLQLYFFFGIAKPPDCFEKEL